MISIGIGRASKPAASVGTTNRQGLSLPGLGVLGPRHDEHVVGLVDAGDVDLAAVEQPLVAVAAGGRGDVVGVGAGVGLGDRERHRAGAVGDARAASAASARRCRTGDHRPADRRADDHHQQRAALCGELLAHRRDVADAAAPAAVLLGDVDAEVAVLAHLQPQVGRLAAAAGLLGEVLAPVLRRQLRHLLAQLLALLGLAEARHCALLHDGEHVARRHLLSLVYVDLR